MVVVSSDGIPVMYMSLKKVFLFFIKAEDVQNPTGQETEQPALFKPALSWGGQTRWSPEVSSYPSHTVLLPFPEQAGEPRRQKAIAMSWHVWTFLFPEKFSFLWNKFIILGRHSAVITPNPVFADRLAVPERTKSQRKKHNRSDTMLHNTIRGIHLSEQNERSILFHFYYLNILHLLQPSHSRPLCERGGIKASLEDNMFTNLKRTLGDRWFA